MILDSIFRIFPNLIDWKRLESIENVRKRSNHFHKGRWEKKSQSHNLIFLFSLREFTSQEVFGPVMNLPIFWMQSTTQTNYYTRETRMISVTASTSNETSHVICTSNDIDHDCCVYESFICLAISKMERLVHLVRMHPLNIACHHRQIVYQ